MTTPVPDIATFALGDFQTNCHVIRPPDATECWIIDPGFEPERMLSFIETERLTPIAILLTHAHVDHIAGVEATCARFGDLPLHLHRAEERWCEEPMLNLSAMMGQPVTCRPPTSCLDGGESIVLGPLEWDVVHAPGHSPGSVLFIHHPSRHAIVGDTLFAGSIGRIDFPTSDAEAMRRTIHETLMSLPDDMTVHPGHGPRTSIGVERTTNPFVVNGF